ncbi:hypothetical protein GCM10010329_39110 [Streptomyces spiroverticillatus]|uniref:Glycosyltransferase 2-like domain-containing protein n=1 Tax=Streptomyces finlayi TaxID=67296 RepID=A0A918WY00_9ACTN|nr:bifunctional glycosyltransferase/CDP-glycerol:glycerophosphate glycerophosphotransferase [Streptomyces finlayi]GHA12257.1 hypothetical protein GCM10010329_39110 [Streptomyces spiroverticillatus]GHC94477.1 hypothetical protein GCM10010334_32510 [Streptomyces finlayi]
MPPRLSVIVPVYNVETYLPACLDSLAAQTFTDIEVLVVDDGSPDDSGRIAAEYAARDPRFKVIVKENAGLGAARNTGLEHLHPEAEFVAFVDSDDIVLPDAYRVMIASLEESGSDFVTGNVHHINATKVWQSWMHRMLAGGAVQRTHVHQDKRLLADRTAWNKVFRRDFWEKHGLSFPEGVLYEDTPAMIPAHVLAEAVDVISEPVYLWRLRDGEQAPSITQRRTEPRAVRDRTGAVQRVSRFLATRTSAEDAELKHDYDRSVLTDDLRLFLNVLPDGGEEYHAEFLRVVNGYLDGVDPKLVMELPAADRVKWLLVRKHAMAELVEMISAERRGERVEVSGLLRKYAQFSGLDKDGTAGLSKLVRRIDPDLELKAPLQEISWEGGRLRMLGHAWIDNIDQATKHSAVKVLQLKKGGSRRRSVLPLRNVHCPEATTYSGQKQYNYDWAGWEVFLDPAKLAGRGGVWQEGVWHVGLGLASAGLVRKRAVHASGPVAAAHPPYKWLSEDFRLVPSVEKTSLKLRVEKVRALVTGHRAVDGDIEIEGTIRESLKPGETVSLRVTNRKSGEVLTYAVVLEPVVGGRTPFLVRVPLADVALLPEHQDISTEESPATGVDPSLAVRRDWSTALLVHGADGKERQFSTVVRDGLADRQIRLPRTLGEDADRNEVALLSGANGYLKFSGRPLRARLTRVRWQDGRYFLSGTTPADLTDAVLVVSARDFFDEKTVPLTVLQDGSFEADFAPSKLSGPKGSLPLKSGRWNFFLRSAGSKTDIAFVADRLAVPSLPAEGTADGRSYALESRWFDYPQLNCLPDMNVMEHGEYRQNQLLREVYRAGRELPLRDSVLYLSFNGRQFSDSPRAIHEELVRRGSDLEHLWLVRDSQLELPDTMKKVSFWCTDWYEALARSKYIVTNAHLPHWMERRPGQVVVQTWHGTMLKRIGLDIDAPKFDPDYHHNLRAETKNWSMLVSANRFSTPILKRAMGFDGPVVETGYPRNDYFYAPDRDVRAKEIRERLNLPEGKKVVLYAPTWRDDLSHRRGQFRFDMQLDLDDAQEKLGADHVLLVRRHANIVDAVPGAGNGFVFDVSEYPDIADLYLVSDVLITDYSSVMFDFAHTRRPMLFFTYDLEHYRDKLRGFYFDFEKDAPGPLIATSQELVRAVREVDEVSVPYREKYEEFLHQFCDLDDGQASARVADLMFEAGADPRH